MSKESKLLIGAIILATTGFIIPVYSGMIWLGLFISLLFSSLFLVILTIVSREHKPESSFRVLFGISFLLILFHSVAFTHEFGRKDFQEETLFELRFTLDEGIVKMAVQEKLLFVLGQYYQQGRESIVKTAQDLIPQNLGNNGRFIPDYELEQLNEISTAKSSDDGLDFYYILDGETKRMVVVVVAEMVKGADPVYKNYDGKRGQLEMKFTLSKEGVTYEILN